MEAINKYNSECQLISHLKTVFGLCMERAARVIVPLGGFRLPSEPGKNRRPINMAFFESFSYLMAKSECNDDAFIINAYDSLLNNQKYIHTVTYSVDNFNQINERYSCIDKILGSI